MASVRQTRGKVVRPDDFTEEDVRALQGPVQRGAMTQMGGQFSPETTQWWNSLAPGGSTDPAGWQNPAMQAPAFAPPGASMRQQGNTTVYENPGSQPQSNPLLQALGNYQAPTIRQAEQATFQMLPPAYGFQQEMMQAPLIAKQRERAMDLFNQGQRQTLGAADVTSRNQLGQGELMLKQQLGLGELGVKGGELGLRQQELSKKYDPANLILASMAQSGRPIDPLAYQAAVNSIKGVQPARDDKTLLPDKPADRSPIDRLADLDVELAMAVRDMKDSSPEQIARLMIQKRGPDWMKKNWELVGEVVGGKEQLSPLAEADPFKSFVHGAFQYIPNIGSLLTTYNPFSDSNVYTQAGRAEMARRRNRPVAEMGRAFSGQPEDRLMKLIAENRKAQGQR